MILKRLFAIVAAVAAIMMASAVCVAFAALAVYALLRTQFSTAGAAAVVVGVFALVAVIIAVLAIGSARGGSKAARERDPVAQAERLVEMIRGRPWFSSAVTVVLGLLALRSPAVIEAVARAFFDAPKTKGRKPKG